MSNINRQYFLIILLSVLLVLMNIGTSQADAVDRVSANSQMDKTLLIVNAYQPLMPSVITMHAGYLTVKNISPSVVTIRSASSPDYESVSIHQSVIEGDMVSMNMMHSLTLEPDQKITLKPGGMHLMLHGSKAQREVGDRVSIIFQLDSGVEIPFEMRVIKL